MLSLHAKKLDCTRKRIFCNGSHRGTASIANNGLLSLGGLHPEFDAHHQDRFLNYVGAELM